MKWIGRAISYFALFIIFTGTIGQRNGITGTIDWGTAFIYIIIGGGIYLFGHLIGTNSVDADQGKIDTGAIDVFGNPEKFRKAYSLYLRPFKIDGSIILNRSNTNLFDWDQIDRPGDDGIERILADALQRTAPLVALGGEHKIIGPANAGRFDDWKKRITSTMEAATYILIIPSFHDGTLWEIGEIIKQGHTHKAIFVIPPSNHMIQFQSAINFSEMWDRTIERCKEAYGITIPNYSDAGAMFLLNENLEIENFTKFKGYTTTKVAKTINTTLGYG